MRNFDIIALAISIALAILSIGVGAFAIWLGLRFNDRSITALEEVKILNSDIRAMTEVSLTHLKDFSSKMLESLLGQKQYARPREPLSDESPSSLEEMIRERVKTVEKAIAETVEEKVRQLVHTNEETDTRQTQEAIDAIKRDISRLSITAQEVSSEVVLPIAIRDRLRAFINYPAHYVLLAGIVRSGATSLSDLEKVGEQFHFPSPYESGVSNLIQDQLLVGRPESFSIPEDSRDALTKWVDRNWTRLSRLIASYSRKSTSPVEQVELAIARELDF